VCCCRCVPVAGAGRLLTGVVTDLTELRQAQSALEQANADLEARVAERTAALTAADRHKDEFLAILGHELRNPLSVLSNALYLLQRRGTDPAAARSHELMERQLRRLVRLADDLTELSRIRQGKITLVTIRLDLARLIRDVVEENRSALEEAGLTLSLDLPPEPLWVEGDTDRLVQVFVNLLNNAAKFTDAGGRVTVAVGSGQWSVVSQGSDTSLSPPLPELATDHWPLTTAVVTVRDTGIGIEPEMLPQIFDSFCQVEEDPEAPRARGRGGLGLGLALVKALTEMHGGTVTARSDGLGVGSEFTVSLPLAEPPAPEGG
jgi:signal transduction histidine kinase